MQDIIFTQEKHVGIITLNRPQALNALSLSMIISFYNQLKIWEKDESICAVVVRASADSKVFCAGGDVRFLYEAGLKKDPKLLQFFQEEYKLNQYIHDYSKPYIALLNGVTMGGGVGISLHGSYSIASQSFSFAMPETAIGFFPDIGASYLLAKCKDNFGIYLGLTGNRLNAADAYSLGLIKYIIDEEYFDNILIDLIEANLKQNSFTQVDKCLSKFPKLQIQSSINLFRDKVASCFGCLSIEELIEKLKDLNDEWAKDILINLSKKSPLSLKVTLRQLLLAKNKKLSECLAMDKCLVKHFMQDKDFYEGVRALLIDKDKSPHWNPSCLDQVTALIVDGYFVKN